MVLEMKGKKCLSRSPLQVMIMRHSAVKKPVMSGRRMSRLIQNVGFMSSIIWMFEHNKFYVSFKNTSAHMCIDGILYTLDMIILYGAHTWKITRFLGKYPQITFEHTFVYKFWHTRHCNFSSGSTYFKHFRLQLLLCTTSTCILFLLLYMYKCGYHPLIS